MVLHPQDVIYLAGAADPVGVRPVPVHRRGRAAVVRLRLPADRLHRDLHVGRAPLRGRPPGAHEARRGAVVGCASSRKKRRQAGVWLAIGLWTGFTFVAYFTPARTLAAEVLALRRSALGDVLDPVLRLRHLRQRRLHARAGLQVHVPLRALPERDVRPRHADHQLRRAARRAARLARARRRPGVGRQGRLHRLHAVRAGLPDRHRHPEGPAVRVHRLRRLHRRLQRRDGQDGLLRAA